MAATPVPDPRTDGRGADRGRVDAARVYDIGLRARFRGITRRRGMVWRGSAGWAEWSPFADYAPADTVPWLAAAHEAAELGFPPARRTAVEVNCTVPAVAPEHAHTLVVQSGCRTAKVKVAESGQSLADDLARVEAVRDALGPAGRLRIDANGGWDVAAAFDAICRLSRFDLQYAEQPCRSVDELASLRTRLARSGRQVLIAADESIRRAADPYRVVQREAADIAVLKVQPLGGVRACLEIAERIGLPVVVSSALETSVGIRAGLALAAALPELPYACGLNTVPLLDGDLAADPLVARNGWLTLSDVEILPAALDQHAAQPAETERWQDRRERAEALRSRHDTGGSRLG